MAGSIASRLEDAPVWTLLELLTVAASVGIFLATLVSIAAPPGQASTGLLQGVIVAGVVIALFWTTLAPALERLT